MTRYSQLDALRGFAVLGLFLMNLPYFGLFEWGYVSKWEAHPLDVWISSFINVFIDGRFRTLFCLLFGCAIALQFEKYGSTVRIQNRNRALIVLGFLHGLFIWAGDILFAYGCAGLLLVRYLEESGEKNLREGFILLVVMSLVLFVATATEPELPFSRDGAKFIEAYESLYSNEGSFILENAKNFFIMLVILPFLTLWYTLALMRIGLGAWQKGWFKNGFPSDVTGLSGILAIMFSALVVMFSLSGNARLQASAEALNWLSALFTSVVYIAVVFWLMKRKSVIAKVLESCGKLALTIYITQSVIGVALFRYFFPEWVKTFDLINYVLLATLVVSLQVITAYVYLKFFKQGPLEWCLTRWLKRKSI